MTQNKHFCICIYILYVQGTRNLTVLADISKCEVMLHGTLQFIIHDTRWLEIYVSGFLGCQATGGSTSQTLLPQLDMGK